MNKVFGVMLLLLAHAGCVNKSTATEASLRPQIDLPRTRLKAIEALKYCRQKKCDTTFCVLIDMSLHSGVKRFIVWDFKGDTIQLSGMVSHGCCNYQWGADETKGQPRFSNVDGSHCTSLGKYKIGNRGYSNWGIHVNYLMHGLEKENANALARQIVLHSWEDVSDSEVYPSGTPEGWGCPAVSNNLMKKVDALLKGKTMPVLMWIYQ